MENAEDQFSLKWNNFQSNLATGFHDLLQDEDMVDVTLAAEGKFIQAHKIILSVCSPYFKQLFKVNPCKHPIVVLKDVGHQELTDMLDFMYRGEANVRQDDLSAFLKLAETLKVKGLAGDQHVQEEKPPSPRRQILAVKKKRIVEQTVFEPDDDPGDSSTSEPKRKRKRPISPHVKTESASSVNTLVPVINPKQEVAEEDVEFLEDSSAEQLIERHHGTSAEIDDSNLDMTAGDETQDDGDISAHLAGPSQGEEAADQVPAGMEVCYLPASTRIVAVEPTKVEVKKPPVSPIWNYFARHNEMNLAVCGTCHSTMRVGAGTTSGLIYHLKAAHPDLHTRYLQERVEWERVKDFYVYQNYMKRNLKKKKMQQVQVVQMSDTTSAIIVDSV